MCNFVEKVKNKNRNVMRKYTYLLVFLIFSSFTFSLFSQTKIKMKNEGGVYTVPCSVNGLKLRFIFDTGASNVCISAAEASFMLKNGYLEIEDVIGSSKSVVADGSMVENTRIMLKSVEIGGLKLKNVEAVVIHSLSAPLLFGQSAIQKLGKIQLDKDNLIIYNGEGVSKNVDGLLNKGREYYLKKLYSAAHSSYNEAYSINSESFNFVDLMYYGISCNKIDLYKYAIEPLLGALQNPHLDKYNKPAFIKELAEAYEKTEQGMLALSTCEEALSIISEVEQNEKFNKKLIALIRMRADIYFIMGDVHFWEYKDYRKAIDYYVKAIEDVSLFKGVVMGIKRPDDFVKEMIKGNVNDSFLGKCFESLSFSYSKLNDLDFSLYYYECAAKVGHQEAKEYVAKFGYKKLKE